MLAVCAAVSFINEPTAAALAYPQATALPVGPSTRNLLVYVTSGVAFAFVTARFLIRYDIGGAHLKIAALTMIDESKANGITRTFQVKSSLGIPFVGMDQGVMQAIQGSDFDDRLIQFFWDLFATKHKKSYDFLKDPRAMHLLRT